MANYFVVKFQKSHSQSIFSLGNGIFLAEGFNLNSSFKRVALRDFGAEVNQIKFSRPSQAAAKMNNWIASKTNNKIDKLVTPGSGNFVARPCMINRKILLYIYRM